MAAKAELTQVFRKTGGRDTNVLYQGIATFSKRLEIDENFLKYLSIVDEFRYSGSEFRLA